MSRWVFCHCLPFSARPTVSQQGACPFFIFLLHSHRTLTQQSPCFAPSSSSSFLWSCTVESSLRLVYLQQCVHLRVQTVFSSFSYFRLRSCFQRAYCHLRASFNSLLFCRSKIVFHTLQCTLWSIKFGSRHSGRRHPASETAVSLFIRNEQQAAVTVAVFKPFHRMQSSAFVCVCICVSIHEKVTFLEVVTFTWMTSVVKASHPQPKPMCTHLSQCITLRNCLTTIPIITIFSLLYHPSFPHSIFCKHISTCRSFVLVSLLCHHWHQQVCHVRISLTFLPSLPDRFSLAWSSIFSFK